MNPMDKIRQMMLAQRRPAQPPAGRGGQPASNMIAAMQMAQRAAQGGQPPQGYAPPRLPPMLPAQGEAAQMGMLAQALRGRGGPKVRPMEQSLPPQMMPQPVEPDADDIDSRIFIRGARGPAGY